MTTLVRTLPAVVALVAAAVLTPVQAAPGAGHGNGLSGHGGGGHQGGGYGGHRGGYYIGGHYGGGHYIGGHYHGGYGRGGYWGRRGYWGPGPFWGGLGLGLGVGTVVYSSGYYGYRDSYDLPYYGAVAPEVVVVPAAEGRVFRSGQPVPQAAARAPDPIFYPNNGQSAALIENDRRECNRWATTQANAMAEASIFQRATYACMEGRGYTVR